MSGTAARASWFASFGSLPHLHFRRDPSFYRRYDARWFAFCVVLIAGLHFGHIEPLLPVWNPWFLLALPFVVYFHVLCSVFVHNASHGSFPRSINRIMGELCGFIVLSRFASWQIVHERHHRFSDDVDKDPHPLLPNYFKFTWRGMMNVEKQLQTAYLEVFGDTEENRKRERTRAMISYGTNIVLIAFFYRLLGPAGFLTLFLPAQILGWMQIMHFNWVTHNALAKTGDYHPVNIDSGIYWIGNRIFFGIYMHGNHHKRANVFNPLFWDEKRYGKADPLVKPYPVPALPATTAAAASDGDDHGAMAAE